MATPNVSVVIPTRGRPALVERAVLSVLAQTDGDLEVIVVIDGKDADTEALLRALPDPRIRILALPESVGGSDARNAGIDAARGAWVAFLDDDDEWLPEKLAKQLALPEAESSTPVFLASQFMERSEWGDRVLPKRSLVCAEPFSEFLFCRPRLSAGTGYVQTSTWLVSKMLVDQVRFTSKLKRNQDVDWMLHAMAVAGARFAIAPEALVIFHDYKKADRVSKKADWRFHFDWLMRNRSYFTRKALSFFVATVCVEDAVRQKAGLDAYATLLWAFLFRGLPTPRSAFFFLYYSIYPEQARGIRRTRAGARVREIAVS